MGFSEEDARQTYQDLRRPDILLSYRQMRVFVGAAHFQFVAPKHVLKKVLPLPMKRAMGDERLLDRRINEMGYLRLCLTRKFVQHMGNVPPIDLWERHKGTTLSFDAGDVSDWLYRLIEFPVVKKPLMFLYRQIFRLYYQQKR
ncbi:hypothetical protein D6779_06510 [Candidatus Parcubacteria bacterium]|nr:MAG: hypothetical protein D6779_06510 [Candidatus Parcubacteria bacterium]